MLVKGGPMCWNNEQLFHDKDVFILIETTNYFQLFQASDQMIMDTVSEINIIIVFFISRMMSLSAQCD